MDIVLGDKYFGGRVLINLQKFFQMEDGDQIVDMDKEGGAV